MKFLFVMFLFVASSISFANGSDDLGPSGVKVDQEQRQQSSQSSSSSAVNSGVNQNIVFTSPPETTTNVVYSGTQVIKNVPSTSIAPLTSSNDTCHGSVTGGVSLPGIGIGAGSTYIDENCKRLKNARELWNYGMRAAALALMCNDPENKEALEVTGYKCPNRDKELSSSQVRYDDPIIRRRLGVD